jgi:hypothetical protein
MTHGDRLHGRVLGRLGNLITITTRQAIAWHNLNDEKDRLC